MKNNKKVRKTTGRKKKRERKGVCLNLVSCPPFVLMQLFAFLHVLACFITLYGYPMLPSTSLRCFGRSIGEITTLEIDRMDLGSEGATRPSGAALSLFNFLILLFLGFLFPPNNERAPVRQRQHQSQKEKKKKNEKPRGRHWKRKLKPAVGTPEELVFRSSSLFVLEPRGGGVRKQEHEGLTKGPGIDSVCRSCQSISVLLFVVSLSPEILRNLPPYMALTLGLW